MDTNPHHGDIEGNSFSIPHFDIGEIEGMTAEEQEALKQLVMMFLQEP
jgi:hypothetical protein